MNLTTELGEFNRRMAHALAGTFDPSVKPVQSEEGTLLFRGPIPTSDDPRHIGTHVAVSLENEVKAALDASTPDEREAMIENLVCSLSTQVQAQYHSSKIGPYALDVVGTIRIVQG
ncbi:MAG: hypothetical protein JZU58_13725 [Curvibacter lanceolatus]|jgi:hypothetical protein|uniref:hypothetical protein n=1 Tax=Curvibacter lanceolatus TaxID=86182 RepID=UPI0012F85DD8|nr:hypothetical protein [Curvibacter lanceolatus]MBV5293400.1 hypothetical protein [Curvibacter lanceolatus]